MAIDRLPLRFVVNEREYELLRSLPGGRPAKTSSGRPSHAQDATPTDIDHNAAAFRSANASFPRHIRHSQNPRRHLKSFGGSKSSKRQPSKKTSRRITLEDGPVLIVSPILPRHPLSTVRQATTTTSARKSAQYSRALPQDLRHLDISDCPGHWSQLVGASRWGSVPPIS